MASAFGHAALSFAIGRLRIAEKRNLNFWFWMIISSVIPDVDSLTFAFGIPYSSEWGHRGFTHSIPFALVWSFLVSLIFFSKSKFSRQWWITFAFLCLSTISHSVLDAMTNGGLGVGFFIPFSSVRYFFPFRPIEVSPISVERFFSERGWEIIQSEMIWIGGLAAVILLAASLKSFCTRKPRNS